MRGTLPIALLLLAGCTASPPATVPEVTYTPKIHTYVYYVTGTAGGADVTYTTGSGTSQGSVDIPMKNKSGTYGIQMTSENAPDFLYISAQNTGEYGEVTCRIQMDDVVLAENTASGAYMIATCQASK